MPRFAHRSRGSDGTVVAHSRNPSSCPAAASQAETTARRRPSSGGRCPWTRSLFGRAPECQGLPTGFVGVMILWLAVVAGSIIDSCTPSIFRWPRRCVWAPTHLFGASLLFRTCAHWRRPSVLQPRRGPLGFLAWLLCWYCCGGSAALCGLFVRGACPDDANTAPVAPRMQIVQRTRFL